MQTAYIVDDHQDSAELLAFYLETHGFLTATFHEFDRAYEAISTGHPCIAIIDLNVPGTMDAQTFIAKTQANHPNLPIVIVSGDPRAKTAAASVRAYFLLKPFSLEDVVERVRESCPSH